MGKKNKLYNKQAYNQIFNDLEAYLEFCKSYGYRFREQDFDCAGTCKNFYATRPLCRKTYRLFLCQSGVFHLAFPAPVCSPGYPPG